MPLIDAQPDALALIYARTLLGMVDAKGGKEAAFDTLGELEGILDVARATPAFGEFLSSRVVSVDRRSKSLAKVLGGRVNELTLRFLQVVNRKGRLNHLPAITAAFDHLVQERFGRVEVDVYTAETMDAGTQSRVRERLATALKKEVVMHPYIEEGMIGGMKIRVGDQFIDASVATQLRRMRDKLQTSGQSELKARFDRIVEG